MTVGLGFRPRSEADRLALCRAMTAAPLRVGLRWADDGWAAVHLAVAGRIVCWHAAHDSAPVDELLARLDLPPMVLEEPDAWLTPALELTVRGPAVSRPLLPRDGPLTSILLCTYNRAHLLMQALDSARAQSRPREIIVVDDGSEDGTAALLAPLDGVDGIRVVHQENTGKPGALGRALREARGEYVLVLDDDDIILPGALHVLGAVLDRDPEAVAVFGDTAAMRDSPACIEAIRPAVRLPAELLPASTLLQIPCMPGACLIRRSAHDAAGEYEPSLVRGQDMDLFLRLARVGPMRGVPVTTFLWRQHDGLRGKAGDRWARQDRADHDRRFLRQVAPVFRRRWEELRGSDRLEGHAWAVGLHLRGLHGEARSELKRWRKPFSPAEAGLRAQAGQPTKAKRGPEALLVVDDGDPGALESLLLRDAPNRQVRACLEVHREPLNQVQLWWPGEYRAQEIPESWLRGITHLRLSSAPDWTPPAVRGLLDLPPLPAPSALLAFAAVEGWSQPSRSRPGLRWTPHPVAAAAIAAREHLDGGRPLDAMNAILPVCETMPTWSGAWRLGEEAFLAMGMKSEAEACRQRVT